MSRLHSERIISSLLGKLNGSLGFPKSCQLGLDFEGHPPIEFILELLKKQGLKHPQELKQQFDFPRQRMICRATTAKENLIPVTRGSPEKILQQALMLGLCTAHLFDPNRPVLWTQASLTRTIELFEPKGFYA